jgi:hypothetical protein
MYDCGCDKRKNKLNAAIPGLGNTVEDLLSPVAPFVKPYLSGEKKMTDLLKPDMKSLVWLAIGALVVPYVLRMVK